MAEQSNLDLDKPAEMMIFVDIIFANGTKVKGEQPVVGRWDMDNFSVMLMSSGDVVLADHKNEKSRMVFFTDRSKNTPIMDLIGRKQRDYLIKEFLSWENLDKLDNVREN